MDSVYKQPIIRAISETRAIYHSHVTSLNIKCIIYKAKIAISDTMITMMDLFIFHKSVRCLVVKESSALKTGSTSLAFAFSFTRSKSSRFLSLVLSIKEYTTVNMVIAMPSIPNNKVTD